MMASDAPSAPAHAREELARTRASTMTTIGTNRNRYERSVNSNTPPK